MFVFTLSHRFQERGVSSDYILPAARDRFDGLFNNLYLDRRLQVRLSRKAIHFLFYQGQTKDPLIEKEYKEIASISLTDPKETEYDILYLADQCEKKCKAIDWEEYLKIVPGNTNNDRETKWVDSVQVTVNHLTAEGLVGNANHFIHFPFIDEGKPKDKSLLKWFVYFFQCCFLHFVLDLENRDSDFSKSPVYDDLRKQVRASMAYRLLCSKIQYALYLLVGESHQSQDEYTFRTGRYAELLMDKKLNEVIPTTYYSERLWFYNPEIELGFVVRKNATVGKRFQLEDHLLHSLRDFFFRKHAVLTAMRCTGKNWLFCLYLVYIILITLFSLFATVCLLHFNDGRSLGIPVYLFYDYFSYWQWVPALAFVILAVLSVYNNSITVFMPRVLVALSIGWLTAFISEDLIKSQLEIKASTASVACCAVLFLISILLFGEARQHSPYYLKVKSFFSSLRFSPSWKLAPIIVHSYFWALCLGAIMQFSLYEGLLKNSEALPEIVFEDTFDNAELYVMHLDNFKDALTTYREDLDGVFLEAALSGIVRGSSSLEFIKAEPYHDENFRIRASSKVGMINDRRIKIDSVVLQLHGDLGNFEFSTKPYSKTISLVESLVVCVNEFQQSLSQKSFYENVYRQLTCVDALIDATEEEIQNVMSFISDNEKYETLISWSCNPVMEKSGMMNMGDLLKYNAIREHYFTRKIGDSKYLFPRMLIFHALIVLIIAFVGQLIVSDKSVTEPL